MNTITQTALKAQVIAQLKDTPEWKKLYRDYKRFEKSLHPGFNEEDEEVFRKRMEDPRWLNSTLTCEAGVMNAKSSTAHTLRRDTDAVIARAGLKRQPSGKFRGLDSPDWDAYARSLGYTENTYDKGISDVVYNKAPAEPPTVEKSRREIIVEFDRTHTLDEIRAMVRAKGLPLSGGKKELIARLL